MNPILLFAILIVSYILYRWWTRTDYSKYIKHYNGPYLYPVIGVLPYVHNMWDLFDLTNLVVDWQRKYGSPVYVNGMGVHVLQISKPKHVEAVLKSKTNIAKAELYDFIHCWLGLGLLTSTGAEWHQQRKLLTPAFHYDILKQFVPLLDRHARCLVEWIKERQGKPIDIRNPLTMSTLDIIAETSMGCELNALRGSAVHAAYINAIRRFGDALVHRILSPWYRSDFVWFNFSSEGREMRTDIKVMHEFTQKVINSRRREHREQNSSKSHQNENGVQHESSNRKKRRVAFLDLLLQLESEGHLSATEVREQVDTFMFEGHDTTATALMYILYCMATNPEYQAKVQREIAEVLDDNSDLITADQLAQMHYMEQCIKESQRCFPSVPVIARKVEEDFELEPGVIAPKGFMIEMYMNAMHTDPDVWPEPYRYDPERFASENTENRHPFAFCPFSAGMRNCIGQKFAMLELKMITAHVLHEFKLSCTQSRDDIRPSSVMVLRPGNPVNITFTARR